MNGQDDLDELLMAHAAGRLPEPVALAVATHLALSPRARARYRRFEALGGVLLETIEPSPLAEGAWDRLRARLDEEEALPERAPADPGIPAPLRPYLPGSFGTLPWRGHGGVATFALPLRAPGYQASLIRVRPGRSVPRHTHEGSELTVVLEGAFRDERGVYRRGDLAIADASVDHRPVADEGEGCVCLAVMDAPVRLTGPIGRLLNPFVRL